MSKTATLKLPVCSESAMLRLGWSIQMGGHGPIYFKWHTGESIDCNNHGPDRDEYLRQEEAALAKAGL